ncbi:MAG: serine/threonine-protein kinase [Gammaproteobacteria bacterium]
MAAEQQDLAGELSAGTRVGPWQTLQLIGRGGSGEVYTASRADGLFHQKVAVKVLLHGAVAETSRFHSEREILARLEHPGIAHLLDGGVHRDGRPFMVMEYVEGTSLTAYSDSSKLDLTGRLKLFVQVCEVVSYAHRSLVVHRDLKPRNILITRDGRVKLLDFGVAKLLDAVAGPFASEKTSAPLTPDYAAPEQLTGQAITTATDVYALGVVLFELLTSRKPFSNADRPVAQAVNAVLNEAPPVPSRAARALPNGAILTRLLEGDLDAIVARCLRKEPQARYESVAALERDVRRYLRSEPVSAREGARLYVLGRFLKRHRWIVTAGGSVVLALACGLAVVSWQAHRIALERDIARRAATREEAVRLYLTRMFRSSVTAGGAQPTTAKNMLDRSAQRVLSEYRDDPYLAGKVVETLSDLYGALEDFEGQAPLLEGFLAQAGTEADPESKAIVQQQLANVEFLRGNTARAAKLLESAQAFWKTDLRRYEEQRLEGMVVQGRLQRSQGDLDGSIATYETALRERTELSGHNHRETAALYNSLGVTYMNANRFDEAMGAYAQALAIHAVLERSDDLDALIMRANMGILAYRYGRISEAEELLRNGFQRQQALSGDSAAVSASMGYYGALLTLRGQHDEALSTLRNSLRIATKFAGAASPVAVLNRLFLAEALAAAGQSEAAGTMLDQSLPLSRKQLGEDHLFVLRTQFAQAALIAARGDSLRAGADIAALIPRLRKVGTAGQPALARALVARGETLLVQRHAAEAIPLLTEALELREKFLWNQSWELAEVRERLGEALGAGTPTGKQLLTRALATLEEQLGAQHPQALRARAALAKAS